VRTRSFLAKGFTLVELLIVVVVLGILAGIVLPAFNSSTDDAKASAVQSNLAAVRSAVDLYKVQHNDVFPGYAVGGGAPTETLFINQLSLVTKKDCSSAPLGTALFPFGPYLKTGIPANPYNGLSTIQIIADGAALPAAGDDSHGWVYKPQTGELKCDSPGSTSDGKLIYSM
jgi:type II secretion system protein G